MKRQLGALLLTVTMLIAASGCASNLDGQTLSVTAHESKTSATPVSVLEASNYTELKAQILGFIRKHSESGLIRIDNYDGTIETDVDKVGTDLTENDPLGAYAVTKITAKATHIVPYYEVEVHISYKDITKEHIDSIITVPTLRYMRTDLQDMLSSYAKSLTVLTTGLSMTSDEALELVRQSYYENPGQIVMLPVTTVDVYPDHNKVTSDRIFDFAFDYNYKASILKAMSESLSNQVKHIAGQVTGSNDGAILLHLCQKLMDITKYDTVTAESGDYTNQNIAATAYGALVTGSAVDEGYAMAYKALCDELGIESYVVIGKYNNKPHSWNIVALEGKYYHVDVSLCDVNGIGTAFLKKDSDMKAAYQWDTLKYKVCDGPITYTSLTASLAVTPIRTPSGNTIT